MALWDVTYRVKQTTNPDMNATPASGMWAQLMSHDWRVLSCIQSLGQSMEKRSVKWIMEASAIT